MTTEVEADAFRKSWVKCSLSCKYDAATSSSREIGKPIDDVHYAELLARIQRLHQSFDAWCEGVKEGHQHEPLEYGQTEMDR